LVIDNILELSKTDEAVANMRVRELLESLSGVGKVRALTLMERLEISPTRRVKGLGRHQITQIRNEFMKSSHAITPGKLLVLSGPGGVGKSTVAKKLREVGDFWVSVSYTTRQPRSNEVNGRDYHFVSHEVFQTMINNGEFLEWAEFAGNRYGTTQDKVEQALLLGKNVLLEIEIAGAKQVKAHLPQSILVFLEPPSWEELVSRLEGRGTDDLDRRAQRLELAQAELDAASSFDVVLVNDEVEGVVQKLIELAS
uniref:guanylate kinase n=1 Tax=Candidatus Planktophila sp. TaxID=2175601 RepID=UPI00404A3416